MTLKKVKFNQNIIISFCQISHLRFTFFEFLLFLGTIAKSWDKIKKTKNTPIAVHVVKIHFPGIFNKGLKFVLFLETKSRYWTIIS